MGEVIKLAYEKYAPRWFKVIRWREWALRMYERKYWYFAGAYMPFHLMIFELHDPYVFSLLLYQPKTQEERDDLKKKHRILMSGNPYVGRNWEIDKYHGQMPPFFDVWERRKKYPEYYGDKYSIFAGDGFSEHAPEKPPRL